MTYKFQRGAAVLSGSITAEEGLDAGTAGISAAGAIAGATTISGSATTFTTIAGTSLALQSGGITAAGAIAGATTISGSSAISGLSLDIEANGDIGGDLTVTNALTVTNSDLVVSTGHISASSGDISGSGNLYALGNLQIGGNATITGDLTINGTTTTVNSTTLTVDDTNITIADGGDADNPNYGLTIGTSNAVTFQTKQTNGANSLASSVPVSASTYYGSGANLSGITADVAGGFSITGYNPDDYAASAIISTAGTKGLHAWASGNVTASYTFDLSGSYSAGNIVIIKGHSATATYPITIRPNDNTTYGIDGDPSIALESNNASVTLIYNGDGGNWTII